MKTTKQVEITPVFVRHVPETLEKDCLYISDEFRVVVHSCLCGCGCEVVTPLATPSHPNEWTLTRNGDKVSMTPSIGNFKQACNSHYIITNNIANFV